MARRTTGSTPTGTLFPYTTRLRTPKTVRTESVTTKPAIHRNALTGDVSRRGQAQEGDGGSDLFGFADAAHRRAQQHFVQVVGVGAFFRGAAGGGVPGRCGVDADAALGPFDGAVESGRAAVRGSGGEFGVIFVG